MDLVKQLKTQFFRLNRKLQKIDTTWIFAILVIIGCAFFWHKLNAARRRHEERLRGRQGSQSNIDTNNSRSASSSSSNLTNNEMRTVSAYKRYFSMDSWKNQKICLCLMQFLEAKNGSQYEYVFGENCLKILYNLMKRHKVYLVCQLPPSINVESNEKPSDATQFEKNIIDLLESNGLINNEFPKYRVLFCQTQKGKSSMVRQLAPTLYIDSDEVVLSHLYPHIPEMVQISDRSEAMKKDMFVAPSITKYFASTGKGTPKSKNVNGRSSQQSVVTNRK